MKVRRNPQIIHRNTFFKVSDIKNYSGYQQFIHNSQQLEVDKLTTARLFRAVFCYIGLADEHGTLVDDHAGHEFAFELVKLTAVWRTGIPSNIKISAASTHGLNR